jgi:flagella basal body P-ring formation protein FlgA
MDAATALVAFALSACDAVSVQVDALGVDPSALEGADHVAWHGDPCSSHPTLRLEVFDGATVARRLTVSPALTVVVEGLVAADDAPAGAALTGVRGTYRLDRRAGAPVDREGPWRATTAVSAGAPLTTANVRPMPHVLRGAEVDLVVVRGAVALTAPGRLLEDGVLGEPVRVHNQATQVAARGVLVAPSTVELR